MRRSLLSVLLPAAVVLVLAACGAGRGASEERASTPGRGVAFAKLDFDGAVSRARSERKLVMVDLYTDWCGWCRKMDREVFQDERVGAAAKDLVAVRVNAEKDGGDAVAERFRVDGFPTVLFLDGEGRLVKRLVGYVGRDEMLEVLRALPKAGA